MVSTGLHKSQEPKKNTEISLGVTLEFNAGLALARRDECDGLTQFFV